MSNITYTNDVKLASTYYIDLYINGMMNAWFLLTIVIFPRDKDIGGQHKMVDNET